ncbi:MAG: RNA polymerase sigma factor [Dokdonella sp.]|uniref:RNA polymerase sigma factor n=1 Tax=Dokdonella sp. TaxID=2291710 RepID=UPI0025C15F8D|nr:RNA polymerase sigma factor [Dokdonella sp.]MBZ0221908.1 RNA polymerase sigma factor [Dokdonella sp.]MCC7256674.1 RNA polymerase sigma factor [Dokdonella sp.]
MQTLASSSSFAQVLDELTLRRAQRGDRAAFAAIYDRFGPACYNLALRILGEPAAAQDIVHEVFVRLLTGLRGYRGEAPFGAWLKRMVSNATIDALRARQRIIDVLDDTLERIGETPEVAQQGVDAWSLLMRMPPRARAVVILHEMEGYTHKELAELFGQSESYSKSILSRALSSLQRQLRGEVGGQHEE